MRHEFHPLMRYEFREYIKRFICRVFLIAEVDYQAVIG